MRRILLSLVFASCLVGARAAEAPPGASSCSGCHPAAAASGAQPASLAGLAAQEIVDAMREFRDGRRSATIMDRVAKGFTDDETAAIAAWWAARRN